MNSKRTYLALVRTQYPKLYYAALNQVFGRNAGMGSLGDDLISSIDSSSIDTSVPSSVTDTIDNAYNTASQDTGTDYFSQIANAITQIAPTVVQTQAAENLLNINTQRARVGLPLYTSQGQIVTGAMLSPTSNAIAQMEAALSGGGSGMLLMGGVALVAILLLTSGHHSRAA